MRLNVANITKPYKTLLQSILVICCFLINLQSITAQVVTTVDAGGGGDFSTITDAVANSSSGTVIHVAPGDYLSEEINFANFNMGTAGDLSIVRMPGTTNTVNVGNSLSALFPEPDFGGNLMFDGLTFLDTMEIGFFNSMTIMNCTFGPNAGLVLTTDIDHNTIIIHNTTFEGKDASTDLVHITLGQSAQVTDTHGNLVITGCSFGTINDFSHGIRLDFLGRSRTNLRIGGSPATANTFFNANNVGIHMITELSSEASINGVVSYNDFPSTVTDGISFFHQSTTNSRLDISHNTLANVTEDGILLSTSSPANGELSLLINDNEITDLTSDAATPFGVSVNNNSENLIVNTTIASNRITETSSTMPATGISVSYTSSSFTSNLNALIQSNDVNTNGEGISIVSPGNDGPGELTVTLETNDVTQATNAYVINTFFGGGIVNITDVAASTISDEMALATTLNNGGNTVNNASVVEANVANDSGVEGVTTNVSQIIALTVPNITNDNFEVFKNHDAGDGFNQMNILGNDLRFDGSSERLDTILFMTPISYQGGNSFFQGVDNILSFDANNLDYIGLDSTFYLALNADSIPGLGRVILNAIDDASIIYPSDLTVNSDFTGGSSEITLDWTDNASAAWNFVIYRVELAVDDGFQLLTVTSPGTESFTDNTITANNAYVYYLDIATVDGFHPNTDTFLLKVIDNYEGFGNAIQFTGTEQVEMEGDVFNPVVPNSGDFTIEFWTNPSFLSLNTGETAVLFAAAGEGLADTSEFIIGFDNLSNLLVGTSEDMNPFSSDISSTQPVSYSAWQHIAFSYDSANSLGTLYYNGQEVQNNTMTIPALATTDDQWRGYLGDYLTESASVVVPFEGQIDEFRVWKTLRTAEEIADHMFTNFGATLTPDLLSDYRFSERGSDGRPLDYAKNTNIVEANTNGFPGDGSQYITSTVPFITDATYLTQTNQQDTTGGMFIDASGIFMQASDNILIGHNNNENSTILLGGGMYTTSDIIGRRYWYVESNVLSSIDTIEVGFIIPESIYQLDPLRTYELISFDSTLSSEFFQVIDHFGYRIENDSTLTFSIDANTFSSGFPVNITWGEDTTGSPGNAILFNEPSSISTINPAIQFSDNLTIEAWINISSTDTASAQLLPITSKSDVMGTAKEFAFGVLGPVGSGADALHLYFSNSDVEPAVNSTVPIALNTWQHVAVSVDENEEITFYINGIDVTTTTLVDPISVTNLDDLFVGNELISAQPMGGIGFVGSMDELRIWSSTRSREEINDYKSMHVPVGQQNLEVYYRFDNPVMGTSLLPDLSGNNISMFVSNDFVASGAMSFVSPFPVEDLFGVYNGSEIDLSWTYDTIQNSSPTFIVERSDDFGQSFSELVQITASGENIPFTYTDNSVLSTETAYVYRIFVSNAGGISRESNFRVVSTRSGAGNAIDLDGIEDAFFLELVDSEGDTINSSVNELNFEGEDFTVEAWFTIDDLDQLNQPLVATRSSFVLRYNRNGLHELSFETINGTDTSLVATAGDIVTDNNWHHIAATRSGNDLSIYLDGFEMVRAEPTNAIGTINNADLLAIGFDGTTHYNGKLDEIIIWNLARTETDIQNDIFTGIAGNEPSVVAYYKNELEGPVPVLPDHGLFNFTLNTDELVTIDASNWVPSEAFVLPVPDAPFDLFAEENENLDQILLTWSDTSRVQIFDFQIEVSEDNGDSWTIITNTANLDFTDNLNPEEGFFYRVSANGLAGLSSPSKERFGSSFAPPGNAIELDGTDDHFLVGDEIYDFTTGDFTIEAWAKRNSTGTADYFISIGSDAPGIDENIHVGFKPGNQFSANFQGDDLSTSATYTDLDWHHYAFTFDNISNTRTLYVDGVEVASDVSSGDYVGNNEVFIGSYTNSQFFDGSIEELRVWSTVRSESQIADSLFVTLKGNESDLVSYFRFDQQGLDNILLPDRTIAGNDGVWQGDDAGAFVQPNWVTSTAFESTNVVNTNDSGPGSLRSAIELANSRPGEDTINFNIPGVGPWEINLSSDLPAIIDSLIIDGVTQPGFNFANGELVTLSGAGTGVGLNSSSGLLEVYALKIKDFDIGINAAVDNTALFLGAQDEGNIIFDCSNVGIRVSNLNGPSEVSIIGNIIGIDDTNNSTIAPLDGIIIQDPNAIVEIGGATSDERNVISGCTNIGINVVSGSAQIRNNYVGTSIDGLSIVANGTGILLGNASSGSIIDGNLISGNVNMGIEINASTSNSVTGNNIGVGIDGSTEMPNMFGISISGISSDNLIGGSISDANIVAHNQLQGIEIGFEAFGNTITHNSIFCNGGSGIALNGNANNNIVAPAILGFSESSVIGNGIDGESIHVYLANDDCGGTQGKDFLGEVVVSGGQWELTGLSLTANDTISATATSSIDGTSTFTNFFGITESPVVPTVDPQVTNSGSPVITGTYEDGTELTVEINAIIYTLGTDPELSGSAGLWSLDLSGTTPLTTGTYDIIVTNTNALSLSSSDLSVDELAIDLTAPNAPTVNVLVTNNDQPTLTGTFEIGTDLSIVVGSNTFVNSDPELDTLNGNWTLDLTGIPLAAGVYDIQVTSTNELGTASLDLSTDELTVDLDAPNDPTVNVLVTNNDQPTITGTFQIGTDLSIVAGSNTFVNSDPELDTLNGNWTLDLTGNSLAVGVYDIQVTSTNEAGTSSFDLSTNELTIDLDEPTTTLSIDQVVAENEYVISIEFSEDIDEFLETEINIIAGLTSGFNAIDANSFEVTVTGTGLENVQVFVPAGIAFDMAGNGNAISNSLDLVVSTEENTDSLNLITIYEALGGSSWSNNDNWLVENTDIATWHGITVTDGKVTGIDLSGNNLVGALPILQNGALDQLTSLNLSDNQINGLIDFSGMSAITSLDVSNNQLLFEDLIPNAGIENFSYAPQATLGPDITEQVHVGESFSAAVVSEDLIEGYQWQKDNVDITGEIEALFTIDAVTSTSQGVYSCELTNSQLPDLTLDYIAGEVQTRVDISGTVFNQAGTSTISNAEVFLLEVTETGAYDTIKSETTNGSGEYIFDEVPTVTYLIAVRSTDESFIGTYFGDVILFEDALSVMPTSEDLLAIDINVVDIPGEDVLPPGDNVISGTLEEDIPDEESPGARIEARRRVRLAGVSLYRSKSRLRTTELDPAEWELVAYTQTDDEGNFSFEGLPDAVYRIQIEFPGVPLDDNALVEFDLRDESVEEQKIELSALITETGIAVEQNAITGIKIDFFKNLILYPTQSTDKVHIQYEKLLKANVHVVVTNPSGKKIDVFNVERGDRKVYTLDIMGYPNGIYFVQFIGDTGNIETLRFMKK